MIPFDTETTGLDVEQDRIVTVTVAHIQPGAETVVRSHLIAVDVAIPAAATEVHGITTEQARRDGKPAAEVLDLVAADLAMWHRSGTPIVGMNLAYDLTILDRELRRWGLATLEERIGPAGAAPVVDVFVIDKAVDRYRKGKRTLADLCQLYGARHDGAHEAESDALAAARVAWLMCRRASLPAGELEELYRDRRYPAELARAWQRLGRMSLGELHEAQEGWYAAQSQSFAAYLRREAHELEGRLDAGRLSAGEADEIRGRAEELHARADAVTIDWPMQPWRPQ